MKPETISGAFRKSRYSNWNTGDGSGLFIDLGVGGDYSDVETHQTYNADGTPVSGSDWTSQNTVDTIKTGTSFLQNVLIAIFGRNYKYQASAVTTMYEQETRTNTILWVAIGLILALGVFLVIRKTK